MSDLTNHNADIDKKVSISSCGQENDLISRQMAIDAITDELMPSTPLSAVIRAKNRFKDLPAVQPEIIRCKDCKYMIDTGDDLMCDNAKGWVVATASDFGCVLAERRTDG